MNKKLLLSIVLLVSTSYIMGLNVNSYINAVEEAKADIKRGSEYTAKDTIENMIEKLKTEKITTAIEAQQVFELGQILEKKAKELSSLPIRMKDLDKKLKELGTVAIKFKTFRAPPGYTGKVW